MSTPTPGILGPADTRRAAALLMHANPDSTLVAGVNAVLTDARDAGRVTELLLALCAVIYGIHPDLCTVNGQAGLRGVLDHYLALETNGETDHE
ncbi:hypothetical protein ACPCXD_10620 [Rhodococcus sp. AB351]|uniref:hypothetical protein n=1 Tax=Rhodococcus sp. AB351 TaxID=3413280 RepID=UPI003C17CE6D